MKASLTQNQLRVYTVIRGFIKQNGYSPTYKELMNLLDLGLPRSITLVPDDENEIKKLREIRDAANIFISRQIEFREAYDSNQASPLTALAGPRVTEAYDRLLAMVNTKP